MSREQCLASGLSRKQLEAFEKKLDALSLSIDWQALYTFALLIVQKRGDLTISDIVNGLMTVFGLTPIQAAGVFGPSINFTAMAKLMGDILAGAPLAVILADLLAVFGS